MYILKIRRFSLKKQHLKKKVKWGTTFFSKPMQNFKGEICFIWEILVRKWLLMVTMIKAYRVRYREMLQTKIASYIKTVSPNELKFEIYTSEVLILKESIKLEFEKFGPCTFNTTNIKSYKICVFFFCFVLFLPGIDHWSLFMNLLFS